jgi:hypothetical protein
VLDANEIKLVIEGKDLPKPPAPPAPPDEGAPAHVLKPELKPQPGLAPGQQPA